MQEINPRELRLVAMNLLARREHLEQELAAKLRKRFGTGLDEEIDTLVHDLARESLVSDRRYIEAYVTSRSGKGYGPERIRQELRQKHVSPDVIDEVLAEAEVDWLGLAAAARQKKFGMTPPSDFRQRAKQLRFLIYRGFDPEIAAIVVCRCNSQAGDFRFQISDFRFQISAAGRLIQICRPFESMRGSCVEFPGLPSVVSGEAPGVAPSGVPSEAA